MRAGLGGRSYRDWRRASAGAGGAHAVRQMPGLGAAKDLSSWHLNEAEINAMTDERIEDLLKRADAGDYEAQRQVDAWIAEALGPVCATAPFDYDAEIVDPEELARAVCCGSRLSAFAG